jgi:hypothetical protein
VLYFDGSLGLFVFKSNEANPLEVWTGLEGCRRLSLPDLKTIGV